MTRSLTGAMVAEVTGVLIRPILLTKFGLDSGDLNLWNGTGSLTWSGDTYTGTGNLLSISAITETEAIRANGVTFTLSGMPSAIISIAFNEEYQGRTVTAWLGMFDTAKAIISDPVQIFSGNLDFMTIDEGGKTSTVSVQAESELRSLTRPSPRKWTAEDQKAVLSLDRGFNELPRIQDDPIIWG